MLLPILEWLGMVAVVLIVITQLVLPAYRGQQMFPWFRKQGKLEAQLEEEVQHVEEGKVQEQIDKTHLTWAQQMALNQAKQEEEFKRQSREIHKKPPKSKRKKS